MSGDLKVLQAAPAVTPRQETVPVPELGGAVICRGLTASEAFAISAMRHQSLGRGRQARAEHDRAVRDLPPGAEAPEFEPPELDFDELRQYGLYLSHLLACGVVTASGMALYSAEQWELMEQTHKGLRQRLQGVVERLSGLDAEDVEKNSVTRS